MAPEWFSDIFGDRRTGSLSKKSDVYSLAMTSFTVRSSVVNHPTPRYDLPVTIRSSRGCYHMLVATVT